MLKLRREFSEWEILENLVLFTHSIDSHLEEDLKTLRAVKKGLGLALDMATFDDYLYSQIIR